MQNIRMLIKNNFVATILFWAFLLNITIEILSRQSLFSLWTHITTHPLYFIYNVLIIAFTMSFGLFFKHKNILMFIVGAGWLGLGIANFVVLSYRITPFAAIDLFIMEWNLNFIKTYLSIPLVVGIICGIILLNIALRWISKQTIQSKVNMKLASAVNISIFVLSFALYSTFTLSGVFGSRILNMTEYYSNYGFVVCFTRSALERGIEEPEEYDEDIVTDVVEENEEELLEDLDVDSLLEPESEQPNIIVIQLEAFFDPNLIVDTEYSENPIPFFTELQENYSSGFLDVAVVGAGTANTEFEVITGMNVDYFGTGEYPYETILQNATCESYAYVLSDLDYTTFAIHNNTGTFYQRYMVYPNLGFDTFISSEFMKNVTTTAEGWIKDECLTPVIVDCLESTTDQDFIFAVSVQGHGPFPTEEDPSNLIQVTASPFEEDLENQIEYYVNQLYEMDLFIKELTEYLSTLDEPTVLVLYGDHIPSLELEAEDIETGDNYQTEYVIWANYDLEVVDQDIETYQLMSIVLDKLDIHSGVVTQLHQAYFHQTIDAEATAIYEEELELLQYDLLYGDCYSLEMEPRIATDMTMGIGDIKIRTYLLDHYIYIGSPKLTEYSVVFVNDKKVACEYEDGFLKIYADDIENGDSIVIKQISSDNTVLYESPSTIYNNY